MTCERLVPTADLQDITFNKKESISHSSTGERVFPFFILISLASFKSEFSQEKFKDDHFNEAKAQIKNTDNATRAKKTTILRLQVPSHRTNCYKHAFLFLPDLHRKNGRRKKWGQHIREGTHSDRCRQSPENTSLKCMSLSTILSGCRLRSPWP